MAKLAALTTILSWRKGVRVYIALTSLLVSLEVWWWASTTYGGTTLVATRMEEIFAWLSIGLLATALSIGPVYKLWPKLAGKQMLFEARRLIGVSAFYFAALHATIAYVALFHSISPLEIPKNYRQAFLVGLVALIILLAMAATSFDPAMKRLGIWWFRLHRLVYIAAVTAVLHAFMIGTHATATVVVILLGAAALLIVAMHARIGLRDKTAAPRRLMTVGYMAVLVAATFYYGFTK